VDCSSSTVLLMYFAPTDGNLARVDRYNNSPDDISLDLILFSASEDLRLRFTGTMESNRVRKLNEPSPVPTLYVGMVEDLLGWVPLFPCFLDGNATSTIPYNYSVRLCCFRDHTEAAMCMRSTLGCGTLDCPSLVLPVSLLPK
jgi:hypothetical protein